MTDGKRKPINWRKLAGNILLYGALSILLILFMVPVYGAIVTAFKSQADVVQGGYWTPPTRLAAENFERALNPDEGNLGLYLGNSVLLTVPASIFSIALGTLAGYGLGKYNFIGNGVLLRLHRSGHVPARRRSRSSRSSD